MNSDDLDNGELDAFLRGEDDLARHLQAMPQPSPSAALDAAILQRAGAALPSPRPRAANAAVASGHAHPPLLSARWRLPAGFAAVALVGVLAHQHWQSRITVEDAAMAPAPPPPLPRNESGMEAVPAVDQAQRQKESGMAAAPPPEHAPSVATPAMPAMPAMRSAAPAANARALAVPQPEAWIGVIDVLLDAGRPRDALAEWEKFRSAYPDYPVADALSKKIGAARKPVSPAEE